MIDQRHAIHAAIAAVYLAWLFWWFAANRRWWQEQTKLTNERFDMLESKLLISGTMSPSTVRHERILAERKADAWIKRNDRSPTMIGNCFGWYDADWDREIDRSCLARPIWSSLRGNKGNSFHTYSSTAAAFADLRRVLADIYLNGKEPPTLKSRY